jgi:phage gp45-like
LHSSAKPAPLEPEEKNAQKGYTSRSKIKLLFDDEKKSVTIQTPGNRVVELNDGGGTITLQDDNGNKIVMNASGIRIEAAKEIKLKAGTTLSIEAAQVAVKAAGSFEAKAGSSAKLEGGALTEIKGGIVKIN